MSQPALVGLAMLLTALWLLAMVWDYKAVQSLAPLLPEDWLSSPRFKEEADIRAVARFEPRRALAVTAAWVVLIAYFWALLALDVPATWIAVLCAFGGLSASLIEKRRAERATDEVVRLEELTRVSADALGRGAWSARTLSLILLWVSFLLGALLWALVLDKI